MTLELEIDIRKFAEYSMNPNHPNNQGKWMAFAALGYDVESSLGRHAGAQDIISQLRQGLVDAPSIPGQPSIHGSRFQVKVRVKGPNGGEGTLVTSWQIDRDRDVPRLVTNWLEVDRSLGE
jgi:hypothetical protein